MRKHIRSFVKDVFLQLNTPEPVYEFGSYLVDGQEDIANLRSLFANKTYIGTDYRIGPGVDLVLDLHGLDLEPASVGTAICLETLEHVENPRLAVEEIHRVMKPDSVAVFSSTMKYPIHDHPYDYWRFTPEAFRSILSCFDYAMVGYAGEDLFPHTVVGIAFKGCPPNLDRMYAAYAEWRWAVAKYESSPGYLLQVHAQPVHRALRFLKRRVLGIKEKRDVA